MLNYDFNNINKKKQILIYNDKEDEKNNETNSFPQENKEDELKNNDEKSNELINKIEIKVEEPSKKYKIKNFGKNLLNLPENYSTDDEDEYNFISIINEPNDSYELAIDSKNVKVYSKIVSLILILLYRLIIINIY